MVFPVVMYGCESWTMKKAECQRIDAFELCWRLSDLESPLDCKEIKPINPKGSQPWIFIGRTGAVAETPILWPPEAKSRLIGKDRGQQSFSVNSKTVNSLGFPSHIWSLSNSLPLLLGQESSAKQTLNRQGRLHPKQTLLMDTKMSMSSKFPFPEILVLFWLFW